LSTRNRQASTSIASAATRAADACRNGVQGLVGGLHVSLAVGDDQGEIRPGDDAGQRLVDALGHVPDRRVVEAAVVLLHEGARRHGEGLVAADPARSHRRIASATGAHRRWPRWRILLSATGCPPACTRYATQGQFVTVTLLPWVVHRQRHCPASGYARLGIRLIIHDIRR